MSEKLKKYEKIDRFTVKMTYLIALIILVVLLIWGLVKVFHFWNYEETNDAQVQEYINPILSRSSGYVQEIRYRDHQKVQKGDTLVILDSEETKVQIAEAKANLASSEAQLEVMKSNVNTAHSYASVSQAKINAAKAELWQQQQEFQRYKKLYEGEAVTQQKFENIKTQLAVAESNFEAIKNSLSVSQNKTNDASAQIAVAEASIAQKKAAVDRLELEIKYAVITAPSNGFMGKKTLQEGQFVKKGQTLGFIVDENQGKWILANFEETQIANLHEGQKAKISVDAFPGETFQGEIESLSPATGSQFSLLPPDNATGNFVKITQRFPVRIKITEDKQKLVKLRAGMNAEVSIPKS
ncbi:HlyD family secretion protein [Aequorivita capsosiphonis]|uniref:HlyD family secretion protein n=1 Tax=Aequorivita capsosiphonis TaxID=487317 RepID=UPI0004044362|nr:HlyD family secretion protein [Aequorivita capsosiphonis]